MASKQKSYSVSIVGLEKLQHVPEGLEKAQKRMLEGAAEKVARSIGLAAPKRTGKLAASWQSKILTSTKAMVFSLSPYAKAQDRGAYIVAKNKALRFNVGGQQEFARFVRLPAKKYTAKGLRPRRKIIQEEYDKFFGNLEVNQ